MMPPPNTEMAVWEQRLVQRAPTSARMFQSAQAVLAGGMTHDSRFLVPFPVAIEHAKGARKWDPDGNEYIDYVIGHGALILGHGYPSVIAAIRKQALLGTHFGAGHANEIEWAELVCNLVPSAERVRFTSSGTEAVMLAARIARHFSARSKIVKFYRNFHGWGNLGLVGLFEPFEQPASPGLPPGIQADIVAIPPEVKRLEEELASGEVAAVILEPSGGFFGQVPLPEGFLEHVREMTKRHGVLLIFDEVVTGFRWAPGGAQERFNIIPDITILAKILGGGLPAGAVAGPREIMAAFEFSDDPQLNRHDHLYHPGTFNGNPLSAAAGTATLRLVAAGAPGNIAEENAKHLRDSLNAVLSNAGIPGTVYGHSSDFHIYLGPEVSNADRPSAYAQMRGPLGRDLRSAMLSYGVDLLGPGGTLSMAHTHEDIDETADAFARAVKDLSMAKRIPEE